MAALQKSKNLPSLAVGQPDRANWNGSDNRIYTLSIVDTNHAGSDRFREVTSDIALSASDSVSSALESTILFSFRHNPQSMSQDMPPAVSIQPTFGGMFIEHQGQPFASINLSGTFGLRPDPKPQQTTVLGISLPSLFGGPAVGDTGLPVGETTGFDDMYSLRSLFASYFKSKVEGKQTIMIWTNAKNGDAYVVEPVGSGLVISRDKSSPMSATYQISLKAVNAVDTYLGGILTRAKKELSLIQKWTKFSSEIRQAGNFVRSLSETVSGGVKSIVGTFLDPVSAIAEGLGNVATGVASVLNIPRDVVKATLTLTRNALNELDKLALVKDAAGAYADPYKKWGLDTQIADLRNSLGQLSRSLSGVATEKALFATTAQAPFQRTASMYPTSGSNLAPVGLSGDVINQPAPTGAANAYIRPGDTIRSIALRYLGDAAQWQVLARLNNLRAPYVSPAGDGRTVLRPGQLILVPSAGDSGQSPTISPGVQQYPYRSEATAFDDVLGVDARLRPYDGQGTMESFDLVLDDKGDVARVRGQENMNQAITLKFATENGELPLHPEVGVAASVGARVRNSTFGAINFTARAALLADPRITSIEGLSISLNGTTLQYSGVVQLAGGAGNLSLNYVLR